MADDSLQELLVAQLAEQTDALEGLAALLGDDQNPELVQLHKELMAGLQETQMALADYKPSNSKDSQPTESCSGMPAMHQLHRFIAPNGRWYLGRLLSLDQAQARMQFEHPSEPYMLHSLQVSAAALQPYNPQQTQTALSDLQAGSTVFARLSSHGLFERSELDGIDPALKTATVTVVSSGVQHQVNVEQIIQSVTLNDTAKLINSNSDSENDHGSDVDSSSDDMALSEDEAEVRNGTMHRSSAALAVLDADLAASQAAAAGPQTDTAHFADWENTTRGIGSKLLAGMGYVKGVGLGRTRLGMANPLAVSLYPPGAGLGSAPAAVANERSPGGKTSKRKRGGARARQKKFASKSRASKEQHRDAQNQHEIATGDTGLFSLINSRLGDKPRQQHHHAHSGHPSSSLHKLQQAAAVQSKFTDSSKAPAALKPQDRKSLIAHQDYVDTLKQKVVKLEAMAARNSNDKGITAQVARQLDKVRAEIAAAEAVSSGHASALSDKEKQKKWMKF
ncbi:hypothetical protein WJX77_000422 [Trebouxia sp. C0004]